MHETPDAVRSPDSQDSPISPGAPSLLVPSTRPALDAPQPGVAETGAVAELAPVALPPSWVQARREADVYHPWPSSVWPRAWSSVVAWGAALLVVFALLAPIPPSVTDLYTA